MLFVRSCQCIAVVLVCLVLLFMFLVFMVSFTFFFDKPSAFGSCSVPASLALLDTWTLSLVKLILFQQLLKVHDITIVNNILCF